MSGQFPAPGPALPPVWVSLALAAACYALLWPLQTHDMRAFLIPWVQHIQEHGPVGAFARPFSNYTPTYLYLLALGSPLIEALSETGVVKSISVLGTVALAWSLCRLLRASGAAPCWRAAAFLLTLPSVMFNAAFLGQCDALWAAPCVMAVACAIERRPAAMLFWCGLAFAFKAQAIFIAPFAVAMLWEQRAPLRLCLIPPPFTPP